MQGNETPAERSDALGERLASFADRCLTLLQALDAQPGRRRELPRPAREERDVGPRELRGGVRTRVAQGLREQDVQGAQGGEGKPDVAVHHLEARVLCGDADAADPGRGERDRPDPRQERVDGSQGNRGGGWRRTDGRWWTMMDNGGQ